MGVVSHTLFINACNWQLLATWKAREGVHMRTRQQRLFSKVVISATVCTESEWSGLYSIASVSGLSLLGDLHWLSIRQSLCVSQSCVPGWTACWRPCKGFSIGTVISNSPSLAEGQILEACMTDCRLHRGGSQGWLKLVMGCSDPWTAQSQCPCTSDTAIVEVWQLVAMVASGGRRLLLYFSAAHVHVTIDSEVKGITRTKTKIKRDYKTRWIKQKPRIEACPCSSFFLSLVCLFHFFIYFRGSLS